MTSPTGPPIRKHFAAKLPFFYGWLMVPVAVVATAVTGVGQTYGISVFNPSLLDSLGISFTALSGAYLVGTLLASLPQPLIGALMDRLGIRSTMLGVVLLLGLACIFFCQGKFFADPVSGILLFAFVRSGGIIPPGW